MSQFARETEVLRMAEDHWRGELHRGWRIGEVPNGGYTLAVAGRVLREALPHRDPLSINAFYLAPTVIGPVDCRVELLRTGGSTSFGNLRLYQQDELKLLVTAAYTDLDTLKGPSWSSLERPDITPFEACGGGDSQLEFASRVDVRLAEGAELFRGAEPGGRGEFSGWVRHADGSDPDIISLLMFADAFPPPVLDVLGLVGWVPTVELTVQVRAHPAPGPLQVHLVSRALSNGVVEEDGEYWDSDGNLVALSRQTAKVRVPASGG